MSLPHRTRVNRPARGTIEDVARRHSFPADSPAGRFVFSDKWLFRSHPCGCREWPDGAWDLCDYHLGMNDAIRARVREL